MIRALVLCLCLAACSFAASENEQPSPLLFDAEETSKASSVIIGIPGALTSIKVLRPIDAWQTTDRAVAYYRLPGYDDHPSEAPLSINRAASEIATFVVQNQFERVYFVGHSTGAAIALEASKALMSRNPNLDIHIAGISTALPAPEPLLAGLRSAGGTIAAVWRARSLHPRTVWLEQYRRISYGRDASYHAEVIERANQLVRERGPQIQLPEKGLGPKHFAAILGWQNVDPARLDGVDMVFWHGGVDPVFPAKAVNRFVKSLPGADLNLLEHHGHVILLTYPQIWDDMARRWRF